MENYSNNSIEQQEENDDLIPMLRTCWYQFRSNWGWFLLSAVVCLLLGFLYQLTKERIYQRQSVILIEENSSAPSSAFRSSSRNGSMNFLMDLNGISIGDNLKNEIFILSSARLMGKVVDKFHLDIDYTTKEMLHDVTIYGKKRPFEVVFQRPNNTKYAQLLTVTKKDDNTVTISDMTDEDGNDVPSVDAKLGQMIQSPYGPLCVVRGNGFNRWEDEKIKVSRLSKEYATNRFLSEIDVSEYDKDATLIVLNCIDPSVKRADDVLNGLYESYRQDVVDNKNRVAQSTSKFVEERIRIIGQELSSVEGQLANFKKQNNLVDFDKTATSVLTETSKARQQTLMAETELNVARYLDEYMHKQGNNHDLIPSLNLSNASFN